MKKTVQRSLPRLLAKDWFQAVLVLLLALVSRLIALQRPIHHNEFFYALTSRDLLLRLKTGSGGLLPLGLFRAVTLTWEAAILLFMRYWLHVSRIWPLPLRDIIPLEQFSAFETSHPLQVLFTMRLSTMLTSVLGIVLIYFASRHLWGWRSAVLVAAFVSLDPFFLGFSRLLVTDGHVATWTGVAILTFLVYLQCGKYRWAGVTMLATALALLSKPSAILLLGFLPLASVGYGLAMGGIQRTLARRILWSLVIIGGIILLWGLVAQLTGGDQSLFAIFRETIRTYATDPGELKFLLGKTAYAPAWYFYLPVLLARTTPGIVAGICLGIVALCKIRKQEQAEIARWMILAFFVILFIAFVSVPNIKIDRYLLPIYPVLGVLGARGFLLFWQWAKRHYPPLLLKTVLASLAFSHFVGVLITFPYYTTYYTPLLGRRVVDLIQVGYGEGLDLVADYLNRKTDADTLNVLSDYSREVLAPRFKGNTWQVQTVYGDPVVTSKNLHTPSFFTADYVVTDINQIQRKLPDPQLIEYFLSRRPEMEVWLAGLPYATVYPGPIYGGSVPDEAVPLEYPSSAPIHLLAYQTAGTGDTEIYTLTFFWQAKTLLTQDFSVVTKLLSADGQVWGSSDGWPVGGFLPTSLWEPGAVVRDDHNLRPLPGTPPGTYLLEVSLVDSTTGQTLSLTSGEVGPGGSLVLQAVELDHLVGLRHDDDPPSLSVAAPQTRDIAKGVSLLGYSPAAWEDMRPGEPISIALLWQATRSAPPVFALRWQLAREGATGMEIGKTLPGTDRYPLPNWRKREIVRDQLILRLPARMESGLYQLQAVLPNGDTLEMGPVQVVARKHNFDIPQLAFPLDVSFGDVARLLGYDLDLTQVDTKGQVQLTLFWQAQREMETPYKVFVHLLDESGQIVTQVDREPQAGQAPSTSWLSGEVIIDEIKVPVTEATAVTRSITVGLYDPSTGQRVPVLNAQGAEVGDNVVLLVP